MKHFYHSDPAAFTLRPVAKVLGTTIGSKIFLLLLLGFFLLGGGKSMAQVINTVNTNCALQGQDVTLTINGSGFKNNASEGASRVIINGNEASLLVPSSITTTSITVFIPKALITGSSFSVQVVQKGAAQTDSYSGVVTANTINLVAKPGQSCSAGTVTLGATGAQAGQYRWYNANFQLVGGTGDSFTTPSLNTTTTYYVSVATSSSCESSLVPVQATIGGVSPVVTGDRRCTEGQVTLTASGAPDGGIYKWYTSQTGGTELYEGPVYTPTISATTTYYVGIENSATCVNPRVPVTAEIGSLNAPTVSASVNCNATGAQTITFYASGGSAEESYTWYDSGDNVVGTGPSIQRTTNQNSGLHYVVLSNGTCTSAKTHLVVPANNNMVPDAPVPFSVSRCGSGTVLLIPPAEPGMTYRWYSSSTGGNYLGEGPTFTTPFLSSNTTFYVSKVNTATLCESTSRAAVSVGINSFKDASNPAKGDIVQPNNPKVNEPATFGYVTENFDVNDVISHTWYIYYADGTISPPILTGSDNFLHIQSMPANLTGIEVHLNLAQGVCYNSALDGVFIINNLDIVTLPVELISFKAQRHAKGVNLTWATASELDNKGFEVQVSTDSKNFQAIGFVASKVGTTSIRQDYSFLDTRAVSGTRYYRLKQIDFDGTFAYSPVRAVSLDGGNGVVAAYPNPFEDVVIVKLNGTEVRNVNIVITNSMGMVLMTQQQETAGNTITLDMANFTTKGMYVLHVTDNNTKHTFKLMKR